MADGGNINLLSVVKRLESLEDEKRIISTDIKEVKKEAKEAGFDTRVIAFLIRERRKDADDVAEFNKIVREYREALGEQAIDL